MITEAWVRTCITSSVRGAGRGPGWLLRPEDQHSAWSGRWPSWAGLRPRSTRRRRSTKRSGPCRPAEVFEGALAQVWDELHPEPVKKSLLTVPGAADADACSPEGCD